MKLTTREITLVAVIPALMAATAWISIPFGIGAPITLQTMFVMIAGLLLGQKLGTISILIYVILGAIGLPIFAGLQGGIGVITGPTGGFILSFILMAFFIGKMKNINFINNEKINLFVILVVSNLLVYMIGGAYMGSYLNINIASTIALLSPFVIGDSLKIIVALYAYLNIRSHLTYEGSQI